MSEIRKVQLKKLKLVAMTWITDELLKSFAEQPETKLIEHAEFLSNEVVLQVIQCVWGKELERQEHEYPSNWWQAFKARWFPEWMLKQYPAKMTRVVLVARELYPNVTFPESKPRIAIDKTVY